MRKAASFVAALVVVSGLTTVGALSAARPAGATTPSGTWTQQAPSASPSGRDGGSMAYDPATGQMVLFGGFNFSSRELGDTWVWDGSSWTQLHPASSPSARTGESMVYDPATGQLLLFGGASGNAYLGDTWAWDGNTWTQLFPANSPSGRSAASIAYDPATGQLVLFGGYDGTNDVNDTWVWDGTSWTQLNPANSPSARGEMFIAYDASTNQLVAFGGSGRSGVLGDTWVWDGTTWTQLFPATSPSARTAGAIAYDPAAGQLVLFGGYASSYVGDTWVWDGMNWAQQSPATSPSAREVHEMAYDPATGTGELVLFGGYNGSFLNDTWAWGAPATPTTPTITNIPASPTFGGSFVASVSTTGDGAKSVTSSTPSICTVGADNLTVSFVGVGTCSLTAHVAQGASYAAADGSPQSFSVAASATSTALSMPASVPFGQSFVVTATVSAVAPGGGTPTGSVQFSTGSQNLGAPVALSGGQASITINMLLPNQTITAAYSGATGYQSSSASGTPNVMFSHPTVSGSVPGGATYNGGSWLVEGANVGGNLTVGPNTSVLIMDSTVRGKVMATNAAGVALCGTNVGTTMVSRASGFVLLGDTGDDNCAGNTFRGTVRLSHNTGGVEFGENQTSGRVVVTGNSGQGAFPDDVGTEIEANTIHGTLVCKGNTPPSSDDQQANTVYGARQGECTGAF